MHKTLQQDKFEDANFKYDKNMFKFKSKNTQIKHFGTHILVFLFFREILQLELEIKFTFLQFGVLISNMRILFSNTSQIYPYKTFLVPNLDIFVFSTKLFFTIFVFATRQI